MSRPIGTSVDLRDALKREEIRVMHTGDTLHIDASQKKKQHTQRERHRKAHCIKHKDKVAIGDKQGRSAIFEKIKSGK